MKLTFLGATHEVTGSCTLLTAAGKCILIDCGMEQGKDVYENAPLPIAAGSVDMVLLTHAHIDHTGCVPMLVKNGFSGPIYTTAATTDLCEIMLRDSAHIQESEAEWQNRKNKRAGRPEVEPIYGLNDAEEALKLFVPQPYDKKIELAPGILVRFTDVGHLLGSASIEIWVTEDGQTEKVVFSGDIGNMDQPLLKDPNYVKGADYVVMESTYGDRLHEARPDYVAELVEILQTTFDRGGNLVIPSFAVGRTQEILYFLREIKEKNLVHGHGNFPVYVDSPMAIEATKVFTENMYECFDAEAMELVRKGINPVAVPGLRLAVTVEESRLINTDTTPKVIISASGMCEAGRIRHHLKHNLWRPECTILFVGYQAAGSLGRRLLDGVPEVKLFGEEIDVRAHITQMSGMSGHADQAGLVRWVEELEAQPKQIFVIHGEDEVTDFFANLLAEKGYTTTAPYNGAVWDIAANECLEKGTQIPVRKKESYSATRAQAVYHRLVQAGRRLMEVIRRNQGGTNKDLARFADQIQSLCDKWDR